MTDNVTLHVEINGIHSQISFTDDSFNYTQGEVKSTIEYVNIIGFDNPPTNEDPEKTKRKLFYINPTNKENILEKAALDVSGNKDVVAQLCAYVKKRTEKVEGRPKTVVVFLNPIGGSANALTLYRKKVEPIFNIAEIKSELVGLQCYIRSLLTVSEKADHFKELGMSYDFSPYDALVILGGDGTINELVNALIHRKQNQCGIDVQDQNAALKPIDIPIALIPTGTGNGLAKITHGCIDVTTSTLHIIKGRKKSYPVFSNFCNNQLVAFSMLMTAYGLFADLIHALDSKRWLRKLRYVVVPAHFFLWKTTRRYNAEISMEYLNSEKEHEDKTLPDAQPGSVTKHDKMTLTNVFILPFSGVFIDKDFDKSNEEFIVLLYKPNPTRFSMIKHFFSMMGNVSRKDFEDTGFITVHTVKSIKATIPNSESDLDLNINLDGEMYTLSHPEIDIRLVADVYLMYSSYERKPKPPQ